LFAITSARAAFRDSNESIMADKTKTRRAFLRSGVAAATIPAGIALLGPTRARAQDLPHLTQDDPMAQALMYVEDASTAQNPRYQAGQMCSNCMQIQGEDGAAWRPCAIFPGKLVSAGGWCSVWVQKTN
jgi:High potential iron-sulfur protein